MANCSGNSGLEKGLKKWDISPNKGLFFACGDHIWWVLVTHNQQDMVPSIWLHSNMFFIAFLARAVVTSSTPPYMQQTFFGAQAEDFLGGHSARPFLNIKT